MSVAKVGAGTEQAQAEVHAVRDTASSPAHSTTAQAIFEDDNRPAVQLVGSANNIGLIQFGDDAASASGQLYYDHSTDKLRVDAGGNADRLTVDASGNVAVAGELDAASLDISGDADIDGTLEADAITVNGTALAEVISDTVGAMVSGNTESGIAVAYQDGDNTIDFTVDASQTGITSITNTSLVVGRDADNDIDFSSDNEITFRAAAADQIVLKDGVLELVTDADVDLGSSSKHPKMDSSTVRLKRMQSQSMVLRSQPLQPQTQPMRPTLTGTLAAARMAPAQTAITSVLATDLKVGEDDQTKIDFEDANQINFYADNTKRVTIDATGLTVNSGSIETATIDFTDGDLAITIADGGEPLPYESHPQQVRTSLVRHHSMMRTSPTWETLRLIASQPMVPMSRSLLM